MRFKSLHLERYGAIKNRSLIFGDAPLTVIYGPNEAGKSTTLEAVGDFLFSVPPQTPRMGVYGGDVLRLGATIAQQSGDDLTLWRRKGRGKTLADGSGTALDDGVLTRLLGGTTRERFQTLFGLDHETLRKGGEELLSAEGDFGRLIVEAGGGLRGLIDRLAQVDKDLASLFTNRRYADKAFYKASDAFLDAERAVKDGLVTWEHYDKAGKVHQQAVDSVAALRDARGVATRAASQLERLVRVVPTLGRLDQVRQVRNELGDDPGLPLNFDDQVAGARAAIAKARESLVDDSRQRSRLQQSLAELEADPALPAMEASVRDIRERTVHVVKQRTDRPNRERELADADGRLDSLRRRLGLPQAADLSSKLPSDAVVNAIVSLGSQGQRLGPKHTAAAAERRRLEVRHAQLSAALQEARAKGFDEAAGVTSDQLALLPSAETALAVRERQAEAALASARAGFVGLGLDPDQPDITPFPDSDLVTKEMAACERLQDGRIAAERDMRRAEADHDAARRAGDRLGEGGEVANAAALASSRNARDAALEPLRLAHLAGAWVEAAEARAVQVLTLERAIAGADDVADWLSAEAQRAAELSQARHRERESHALAEAARSTMLTLDQDLSRRTDALRAPYPEAVDRFPTLPALKDAAEKRRSFLEQARLARAALDELEIQRVGFSAQRGVLDQVERVCRLQIDHAAGFDTRVRLAIKALAQHTEGCLGFTRDRRELAETEALLADAAKQVELALHERTNWSAQWAPALAALGLEADSEIEAAIAGANEWAAAAGILTTLETTRRRLVRMDEDEAELDAWSTAAFERLGVERPADPVAAAKMLDARWERYQEADRTRRALEPELKLAIANEQDHAEQVQAGETELARLACLASVDLDSLEVVCARLKRRRDLLDQEAQLLDALLASGDGLSEDALRRDCGERTVDELRAALSVERTNSDNVEPALEAAVREELVARGHLEAQSRPPEGVALASREVALAEIHDVVERYAKLSLARGLIERAINKVRSAQQDPLIARAGALFAAMSNNAFTGVGADVDAKGAPMVVGLTSNDRTVPVALMSDGSRDQLYLAFRLAGVEAYCRSSEPLPFVADDILVHFDDERTAATLNVLSAFGQVTQVLLFTHHLSVKNAADVLAKTGAVEVVQLVRA